MLVVATPTDTRPLVGSMSGAVKRWIPDWVGTTMSSEPPICCRTVPGMMVDWEKLMHNEDA